MIRPLIASVALLLAAPAAGQDWVTPETCAITPGLIDEAALTPPGLDALKAMADELPNGVGRFWQITAPGGAVSHLFGTMHSTDPYVLKLEKAVEQAITRARVIAPEIDFILSSRAEYSKRFLTDIQFRKTSRPLDELPLRADVRSWLEARLVALGYGEGAGEWLNVGGLVNALLGDSCDDFTFGVFPIQDGRIQMLGQINGAKVIGLEPRDALLRHLYQPANRDLGIAILQTYAAYLSPDLPETLRDTGVALYKNGQTGLLWSLDRHIVGRFWGRT